MTTDLARAIAQLPEPQYREFWERLLREYDALCDELGDDQGTRTFQDRMDARAQEHRP
jgi:hypothetical protein